QAFGMGGFGQMEDQVRRNMEMFERTFAMFAPFARQGSGGASTGGSTGSAAEPDKPKTGDGIDTLKRPMAEMARALEELTDKDKGGDLSRRRCSVSAKRETVRR